MVVRTAALGASLCLLSGCYRVGFRPHVEVAAATVPPDADAGLTPDRPGADVDASLPHVRGDWGPDAGAPGPSWTTECPAEPVLPSTPAGCEEASPQICVRLPLRSGHASLMDIATSFREEIGIAWISETPGPTPGRHVRFAVLDENIAVTFESACLPVPDPTDLSVTGTLAGWLIAIESSDTHTYVAHVARDGSIERVTRLAFEAGPRFAREAEASPLLLTERDASGTEEPVLGLARLDETGGLVWSTTVFGARATRHDDHHAVLSGTEFLIATRAHGRGIDTVRVAQDGSFGRTVSIAAPRAEGVDVAWNAETRYATWIESGSTRPARAYAFGDTWQVVDRHAERAESVALVAYGDGVLMLQSRDTGLHVVEPARDSVVFRHRPMSGPVRSARIARLDTITDDRRAIPVIGWISAEEPRGISLVLERIW